MQARNAEETWIVTWIVTWIDSYQESLKGSTFFWIIGR